MLKMVSFIVNTMRERFRDTTSEQCHLHVREIFEAKDIRGSLPYLYRLLSELNDSGIINWNRNGIVRLPKESLSVLRDFGIN